MSRLIAIAGLAAYTCKSRVDHDGKAYKTGEPITLDSGPAQDLLDAGAIGHADGNAPQALQAAPPPISLAQALDREQNQLMDDMLAEVQRLTAALSASESTAATLQATVEQQRQAAEAARTAAGAELDNLRDQLAAARQQVADLTGANQQLQADATAKAEAHAAELAALNQQLTEATAKASKAPKRGA